MLKEYRVSIWNVLKIMIMVVNIINAIERK